MKILLTLSLILNAVLMGWVLTRPSVPEIVEEDFDKKGLEKVIHSFPKNIAEEMDENIEVVDTEIPKKAPTSEKEVSEVYPAMEFDAYEFGVSADKAEQERVDFLTGRLQVSEEVIQKHEKLKQEYNVSMSKVFGKEFNEPTIQERRNLLDMEEKYISELEKLYGKENFEKFQNFRQKYNERGFKRQREEKVPFIFMGL